MTTWPLITAGVIGSLVAVFHGVVLQRLMIRPVLDQVELAQSSRNLFPLLMHFSTVCWLVGGLALIAAPFYFSQPATYATAIVVGLFYTFGALGNLWGTRGKHPGWILLAIATALILYALQSA